MIGTEFKSNAVKHKDGHYNHFGIHPTTASLYGDDANDIEEITLIVTENQDKPNCQPKDLIGIDYWCWYDFERKTFSMIYPQYFLLNMCFPGGTKCDEDKGLGQAYRVEIVYNTTEVCEGCLEDKEINGVSGLCDECRPKNR